MKYEIININRATGERVPYIRKTFLTKADAESALEIMRWFTSPAEDLKIIEVEA